jgi:hypothetical protein
LSDGTTAITGKTGTNALTDGDWTLVGVIVTYSTGAGTTTIDLRQNVSGSESVTTAAGVFYIEHANSYTTIGAELDNSYAEGILLTGYIYKLDVYNVAKTSALFSGAATATCSGGAGCPQCPTGGTCIPPCNIGTYGAACTTCHTDCSTNCSQSGNLNSCTLCSNQLCTACNTFVVNTCTTCVSNADAPAT